MDQEPNQPVANSPGDEGREDQSFSSNYLKEPQPEPMEVHHHTHTERKKWQGYVFEFFMLFLAVFCGFLAEYKLEHTIEHERVEQYMTSIISDLQVDTGYLTECTEDMTYFLSAYDSLLLLLENVRPNDNAKFLYYHFSMSIYYVSFHPVDRTIQQLKNSGAMRMIRNMAVSDSLAMYYDMASQYQIFQQTFKDQFYRYHDDAYQVFDYKRIKDYFEEPGKILSPNLKPFKLVTYDFALLTSMYNKLFLIRKILNENKQNLLELKSSAVNTMNFLKREYKLH